MNRYQIYLNPTSVDTVDDLARELDISRSQIIRDVLDRMAREYKKILSIRNKISPKNNPLLKMAGIGKSSTGKISENVDDIYLQD